MAAKAFLTDINLSKNVLLNAKIHAWGAPPTGTNSPDGTTAAIEGMISSYKGVLYIYKNSDGTTGWQSVGGTITIGSTTIASSGTAGTTGTPLSGVFFDGSGVTFKGSTSGTTVLKSAATAGSGTLTLPTATGTLVGTGDTGVVTNAMLQNSTISGVYLGQNLATLTFSAELGSGTYNGNGTLTVTPRAGTTSQTGIVSLTDSISSTSTTTAATPNSVKTAYDIANAALPKTGGTMTGNIAMGGYTLTGLGEPVNGSDAATKNYVDNVSQGINVHEGVAGLIDTNLVGTYVPGGGTATSVSGSSGSKTLTVTNSGFNIAVGQTVAGNANIPTGSVVVTTSAASGTGITVTIDKNLTGSLTNATGVTFLGAEGGTGVGATFTVTATGVLQSTDTNSKVTFALNDRVLITGQTTTTQNGIYVVTTAGATGVSAVLTRAADFDNSTFGDVNSGDLVYVAGGGNGSGAKSFGGTQWVQTTVGTVTSGSGSTVLKSVKIDTDAIAFTQFSGTGAVAFSATNVVTTATNTTNATYYPTFGSVNTSGSQGLGTDTDLSYNPSTNTLTAGTFSGALSGNATSATSAGQLTIGTDVTSSTTYYPIGVTSVGANAAQAAATTSRISWNASTAIISALGLTGTSLTFSTSSNGDINLSPNGTGSVRVAGTTPTVSTANVSSTGSGTATTSGITISTGNASITSPTGAPQATSGNLTIDVGSATGATGGTNTTGTVTIGGTNARAVIIDTGSSAGTGGSNPLPGVLNLGTTSARTINIGSNTGTTGVAINSGTGNLVINATGTNAEVQITANGTGSGIQIGSSAGSATNTITMGLSNGTGNITLGRSTDSQTVAIANGAVASTKTKTVNIGTGGSVGTTTISIGGSANSTTTVNGTFQLGSSVLSLAGGNFSTGAGAVTLTAQAGGSSVTLPTSGTLATLAGTETLTNKTIDVISAASATATTTALYGNTTSGTITIGGAVGSTAAQGTINIGNNAGILNGTKAINLGTGATAGTTTITVGSTTGSTTTIRGAVQVPEVGTSGFVKAGASGALSTASIAYSDLPTITNGRVARTVSSSATMNGVATTIVANHALNSRPVNAQLFDSNYNLVETDVTLTDANNVTFTFAVAPANTTIYYWVVTG